MGFGACLSTVRLVWVGLLCGGCAVWGLALEDSGVALEKWVAFVTTVGWSFCPRGITVC